MHVSNLGWPVLIALGASVLQADEVKLSTTADTYVRLADAFRGRPAVMFYEDRASTTLNQELKDRLFVVGKEKGLLDAVSIVAIANVSAYDWVPARQLVIAAVKDTEKKVGVPIYLDWTGVMSQQPWSLKANSSTVVLVDRSGAVRYAKQGALKSTDVDEVLELLGSLIAE